MIHPDQIYRHYKGALYRILTVATLVADDRDSVQKMVVYQDVAHPEKIWVRAIEIFTETIEHNGGTIPRFALVSQDSR